MSIEAIIDRATRAQWEVYIQHGERTDLQLRGQGIEAAIEEENTGYGVRVVIPRNDGAGVGFASCNSFKELEATAKKAHDLARVNRSQFFELPHKKKLPSVTAADRKILRDHRATATDYAEAAQAIVSDQSDVTLTFGKVRTYVVETQILNSHGLSCKSKGTYVYVEMSLKVQTQSGPTELWPTRYARRINDLAPTKIIPEWLDIARTCVKRHSPKTKEMTVIFSPPLVCDIFVPTIGYHASAEAVEQNLSQFKAGATVASDRLSVSDDGLYPYGLRTNPFDDEGQPQQKTKIIEKGVFKDHLHDQLHAYTMKHEPTGNGIRSLAGDIDERFQVPPANTTTNLSIQPGHENLQELIGNVEQGIVIYQGAWVNPDEITTRFGAEIRSGQEIVNGELGEGVVGGTVSGSTLDLITKITGVSDEPEIVSAYSFGCVAPYVRVDKVQISGPS
jgi:PmbA protein